MSKWTIVLVAVAIVLMMGQRYVVADETPASRDARIAELERKLEAALAKIEMLEKRIATLKSTLANVRKSEAARAESKSSPTDDDNGRLLEGTKLTGTMQGRNGNRAVTGSVMRCTPTMLTFRLTSESNTRDYELKLNGNDAVLVGARNVETEHDSQLRDFQVSGRVGEKGIRLSGKWTWDAARTAGTTDIAMELHARKD